ncbi:MAG: outer membrane lipoprotein carrier protein LolA, partial [Nitrospirota bacterium]|nr:outer membrane lipoprotein carrier protein LolA [Nitrospirota bacterium]
CLVLFCSVSASSADILDDLKAKQAKIKTVSANFTQEKKTRLLTKPIRTEGRFLYKQPDRIRWEYKGSVNLQVIFNGKDIWIYYPELKEADKLTGLSQYGSMMQFDVLTMSRDYAITAKKEKNLIMLRLAPKVKGPIAQIEMEIPEDSPFPRMVKLFDQNNEPTTITFRDIKLNPEIQDSSFTFTPEKDVVVRERSLR